MVFMMVWGSPTMPGSLSCLREKIERFQVDKSVKVFNVGDEFVVHCFKAHLAARLCTLLKLSSPSEAIQHEASQEWLKATAESMVSMALMPAVSEDPIYLLHRSFLHLGFLYVDLRNAMQWENGPQIIRHWKLWLPRFLATGCKNYAGESVHLIANLTADFPKHLAYIAIHNRTVNMQGKPGRGKPVDMLMEHYNL